MSHYTVAVITKDGNYERELERFDEGIEVEPYIRNTKQDCIESQRNWNLKQRKRKLEEENKNALPDLGKQTSTAVVTTESDEELYKQYVEEWGGGRTFDEAGNELSTYNPDSKWDWWTLGGRWSGLLKLKNPTVVPEDKQEEYNKLQIDVNTFKAVDDTYIYLSNYIERGYEPARLKEFINELTLAFHPDKKVNPEIIKSINTLREQFKTGKDVSYYLKEVQNIMKPYYSYKERREICRKFSDFIGQFNTDTILRGDDCHYLDRCDSAQVKDIDFTPDTSKVNWYKRFWEINVEGKPCTEEEKKEYRSFYNVNYYLKTYGDFETYLKTQTEFSTYAILYEGEWIEPGQMGWFGCADTTEDSNEEYRQRFNEIISNLEDDDIISIIDCHI